VDGATAFAIETGRGVEVFLAEVRVDLKERAFRPLPVRERMIPSQGPRRRGGCIPTVRDRVVQAAPMDRVRRRVGDKRVLDLVKAFLKAGILTETDAEQETGTGTRRAGMGPGRRGQDLGSGRPGQPVR